MILATPRRRNLPRILEMCVAALLSLVAAQALESRQQSREDKGTKYFIDRLEIDGNRRVPIATIQAHIVSCPGAPYNVEVVQRDAQALRDTGYFVEVRLRVDDSPERPDGKIVMFTVSEKPIIRRVEYRGIKSIAETDILHAYRENKISFSVGSRFDETKLARATTIIEELLSKHGRSSAAVKPALKRNSNLNVVSIIFDIDEGREANTSANPH